MSIAVSDVLVRETWVIGKENPGDKDDYVYRKFHHRYCIVQIVPIMVFSLRQLA